MLGDAVPVRETVKPSWCDIFKGAQPFVSPLASQLAEDLHVSLSLSLFETQLFVLFIGGIIMFVPAKRWGSPCLRDIFSELPTVGSGSGKGHFLVRQLIIVYLCISPRRNFVMKKHPIVSGSGFPTPLAFWVVLRKR